MEKYDLIVIGAGPGGYPAANLAASLGKGVAIVESRELGGTCLNRGCIPTKTLIHTSEMFAEQRQWEQIGIKGEPLTLDVQALQARKDEVLDSLRTGIEQGFKKSGVEVIKGRGLVKAQGLVEVTDNDGNVAQYQADNILIAPGAKPAIPPIPGSDLPGVVDSDMLLDKRDGLYENLVIIGGGVIGMEFATIYNDFGCNVTVIEAMDRILPTMDKEIAQNLKMIMKKRGVDIHAGAAVKSIDLASDGSGRLVCTYVEKDKEQQATADGVLIATGRKPNTDGLFDPSLGIEMNRGQIVVDEGFATNVAGIYAIGDAIGGIQLAHVATAEGKAAVREMFDLPQTQDLTVIPGCVYTNPEIATVGLDADSAKEAGINAQAHKYIMSVNGKSVLSLQDRGFIKIVTDADTGRIIGGQMMCARATDMIGEIGLAISQKMTLADLGASIKAHPTFSEGIMELAE